MSAAGLPRLRRGGSGSANDLRRAGETVRAACGRSKRLVGRERECPLGTICSKIVPEAASLPLATSFTLRKNRPQLFLTPRVKRQCDEWALPFAGSELTGGIYIPAVVGGSREYSVGMPGIRTAVSAEGLRSGCLGVPVRRRRGWARRSAARSTSWQMRLGKNLMLLCGRCAVMKIFCKFERLKLKPH